MKLSNKGKLQREKNVLKEELNWPNLSYTVPLRSELSIPPSDMRHHRQVITPHHKCASSLHSSDYLKGQICTSPASNVLVHTRRPHIGHTLAAHTRFERSQVGYHSIGYHCIRQRGIHRRRGMLIGHRLRSIPYRSTIVRGGSQFVAENREKGIEGTYGKEGIFDVPYSLLGTN